MQNDNVKLKKDFLENEVEALSLFAAFGRAGIYLPTANKYEKDELKKFIREKLKVYSSEYKSGNVSEEKHVSNIKAFADEISAQHRDILSGGRLRIGIAQKLLNLYLKYLWVLGWMTKSPWHCPFDRIIISQFSGIEPRCIKWTKCDHIDCYKSWVDAARKKAGNLIAEWELKTWNESNF